MIHQCGETMCWVSRGIVWKASSPLKPASSFRRPKLCSFVDPRHRRRLFSIKMPAGADGWTLAPHPTFPKGKKLMLIILDGWGEQIPDEFNAIHRAQTPIMDHLKTVSSDSLLSQCDNSFFLSFLSSDPLAVEFLTDKEEGNFMEQWTLETLIKLENQCYT